MPASSDGGFTFVSFVERGHQRARRESMHASLRGVSESALALKANGREPSLIGEVAAAGINRRIDAMVSETAPRCIHLEIELLVCRQG
jgi:hypothetical protein